MGNIVDVVSVVSTATSASITNINKKLKAVGKIDTVKNCEKLGSCHICEIITILLHYYCIDNIYENENNNENNNENDGEKYYLLSSQIALWGCRAINNLAKSSTLKIRFIEIGGKELMNSLAEKYRNSNSTVEWISMAKDTLNQ